MLTNTPLKRCSQVGERHTWLALESAAHAHSALKIHGLEIPNVDNGYGDRSPANTLSCLLPKLVL